MMQATQTRFDSIEIPERPAVSAQPVATLSALLRKRMVLWGGIAAAALLALIVIATAFSGSSRKVVRLEADAPLIKGSDQPLKVSPDKSAAAAVPGRDLLVYERMHGSPDGKPPVERLLPEAEQPLAPPQPRSAVPPAEPPVVSAFEPLAPLEPAPQAVHKEPVVAATPPAIAPASPAPAPVASAPAKAAPPAAVRAEKPVVQRPAAEKPAAAPAKVASVEAPTAAAKPAAAKPAPAAAAKPTPAEKATPAAASSGKFQVQLLAGRDADEVKDAWAKLKAKNPDLLGSLSPNLARADLGDKGTFYRLRAGPLASETKARSLCSQLSGRGTSCIIIRPAT